MGGVRVGGSGTHSTSECNYTKLYLVYGLLLFFMYAMKKTHHGDLFLYNLFLFSDRLECSKENVWSPFSWWGDPSCDSLSMSESKGPNGGH